MKRSPAAAPVAALVAFALFALCWAFERPLYFAILGAIHEHPFPRPFLDTRFVTANVECWSRGIDVYARNPCDPLGRTMDYSPLWLRLSFLARSDRWTPLFGLVVDGTFLFALFRMPWRTTNAFDAVVAIGAVLSWATVFAAERGNTDLLIFAVAVLFAGVALRTARARDAGIAAVLVAGLLKFYPLTLLALLVREPPRRMWVIGALCVVVLACFGIVFGAELARIGGNMADTLFGDMWGARGLPFGLPLLLDHATIRDPSGTYVGPNALDASERVHGDVLLVLLSAVCLLVGLRFGLGRSLRDALGRTEPRAHALLPVGAVLCVGCFFGHQNIGYRAVLLLLVVPGLLSLAGNAGTGPARVVFRVTVVLVVLVLWSGIVSRSRPGWLVLQAAWWWITAVLLSVVVAELRGDVVRLFGPAPRPRDPAR